VKRWEIAGGGVAYTDDLSEGGKSRGASPGAGRRKVFLGPGLRKENHSRRHERRHETEKDVPDLFGEKGCLGSEDVFDDMHRGGDPAGLLNLIGVENKPGRWLDTFPKRRRGRVLLFSCRLAAGEKGRGRQGDGNTRKSVGTSTSGPSEEISGGERGAPGRARGKSGRNTLSLTERGEPTPDRCLEKGGGGGRARLEEV